jgi:hypothetical protein
MVMVCAVGKKVMRSGAVVRSKYVLLVPWHRRRWGAILPSGVQPSPYLVTVNANPNILLLWRDNNTTQQ